MQNVITEKQLRELRYEARQAGDEAQAELCTLALDGNEEARKACQNALVTLQEMAAELRTLAPEPQQHRALFVAKYGRTDVEQYFNQACSIVEQEGDTQ